MTTKKDLLRLPRSFFDDHKNRCQGEVPIPVPVSKTDRFVWVKMDDPGLEDLYSDAQYYSNMSGYGTDPDVVKTFGQAAKRLLRAMGTWHPLPPGEQ